MLGRLLSNKRFPTRTDSIFYPLMKPIHQFAVASPCGGQFKEGGNFSEIHKGQNIALGALLIRPADVQTMNLPTFAVETPNFRDAQCRIDLQAIETAPRHIYFQ